MKKQKTISAEQAEKNRIAIEKLRTALGSVEKLRFRVRQVTGETNMYLMLCMVVCCMSLLTGISNSVWILAIQAIVTFAALCAAVAMFIVYRKNGKIKYYCYYYRTENGAVCISVTKNAAVVFIDGVAHRFTPTDYYTLDGKGFIEWLSGESTGIYAIENAKDEDIELERETKKGVATYTVKCGEHGKHIVEIADGKVVRIHSTVPVKSTTVDRKTGERRLTTSAFVKLEPTTEFVLDIPEWLSAAAEARGITLSDLIS